MFTTFKLSCDVDTLVFWPILFNFLVTLTASATTASGYDCVNAPLICTAKTEGKNKLI
jgi:hypothetical protein